jgi:hypothetical protein
MLLGPMGEAAAQGAVRSVHNDWQIRCDTPPGAQGEQCALIQSVTAEDRANVGLTVIVLKTADQDLLLQFVRKFASESLGDDLFGSLAQSEARHGRSVLHLVQHNAANVRDVRFRHLHFDLLFARSDLASRDIQRHTPRLDIVFFGFTRRVGG